jgi:hypothetical protein
MNKYNTFVFLFVLSVVAGIVFLIFYLQAIFGIVASAHEYGNNHYAGFEMLAHIFSPGLLLSLIIAAGAGLAYRIYGIVLVACNKMISDGEKALWIAGMVIMGFITAIVFLVMAKGKKITN